LAQEEPHKIESYQHSGKAFVAVCEAAKAFDPNAGALLASSGSKFEQGTTNAPI
jgi:hypothetical protein